MRRTRLSRKEKSRKTNRMDKLTDDGLNNPDSGSGGLGLGNLLKLKDPLPLDVEEGQKKVEKVADTIGDLYQGFVELKEPEEIAHEKNLKKARQFIEQYPDSHVSLRVELIEEPIVGAGKVMLVRAGDFLRFKDFDAVDEKTGEVFKVKHENVKDVIGAEVDEHEEFPPSVTSTGTYRRYATPVDEYEKSRPSKETEAEEGR